MPSRARDPIPFLGPEVAHAILIRTMGLQAECPEGVKQAVRVLQVHVVPRGPGGAVAALKVEDVLGYAGSNGGGETALAGRDTREPLDISPARGDNPAKGVAEHLGRQGCGCGSGSASGPVAESGEEGWAVLAWERRVSRLLAVGRNPESMCTEPGLKLEDQVQVGVVGPTHGRVVTLAFAIVLAPRDVDRDCPQETGDAIPGVEVEPKVADLEGEKFGDSEAADGGQGDHEPVAVVANKGGTHAEHSSHKKAVNGEEEGGGSSDQACQAASPGGEFAEPVDGGREARYPMTVLDRGPDGGDDRAWRAQAEELP